MSDVTYPHYQRMSEARLRKHLQKRNTPPAMLEEIVGVVLREKEKRRTTRIKDTVHKKLWNELLNPLRKELKLVRASLLYSPSTNNPKVPDEPRYSTYLKYERALTKLRDRLTGYTEMTTTLTPQQRARQINDEAKETIVTNDGEHWTDWVSAETKRKAVAAFEAIPYTPRARRKIPYEKDGVVPAQIRRLAKTKGTLEYRILAIEQGQQLDPVTYNKPEYQRKLARMQNDLSRVIRELEALKEMEDAS